MTQTYKGAPHPPRLKLFCPACGTQHIDEGEWATRPHQTHQCQFPACGHEWRPFEFHTFGASEGEISTPATQPERSS